MLTASPGDELRSWPVACAKCGSEDLERTWCLYHGCGIEGEDHMHHDCNFCGALGPRTYCKDRIASGG